MRDRLATALSATEIVVSDLFEQGIIKTIIAMDLSWTHEEAQLRALPGDKALV